MAQWKQKRQVSKMTSATRLDPETRRKVNIDRLITEIDKNIAAILDAVLHHPDFRALEAIWSGLYLMVNELEEPRLVGVDILSVSKVALLEDFEDNLDVVDSGLFQHMYTGEFDQPGGVPYASLLMQYQFDRSARDCMLLRKVSQVCASCHCPAIGNAAMTFFGVATPYAFEDIQDWDDLFDNPAYTKWRSLRGYPDSRYLGMMFPAILFREPYSFDHFSEIYYKETVPTDDSFCWTYATYAFGTLLAKSFMRNGWCIHIRGPQSGGQVGGIPSLDLGLHGLDVPRSPLALCFSDAQEHELAKQGFILLNHYKATGKVCVFSAPTIQSIQSPRLMTSNDRLAASLPYVYLVSRIAHYQKVIQRENIGTGKEAKVLELELQGWLSQLVTTMQDPDRELRGRRPLNGAKVTVEPDPSNPGYFNIQLIVQPHMQVEGVNAELMLITRVPSGEAS